jgi:uncharacterized protein with GYD domain
VTTETREALVPKYLFEVEYTLEGMKGLKEKGGTARLAASKALIEEVGGSIESFYFAFGGRDAFIIADVPDNVSAAALGLIVGASGAVNSAVTVLLTPEEIDEAAKKQATYRPPGS